MSSKPIVLQSFGSIRLVLRNAHELNRLRLLVIEHRATFLEAWNAHFGR